MIVIIFKKKIQLTKHNKHNIKKSVFADKLSIWKSLPGLVPAIPKQLPGRFAKSDIYMTTSGLDIAMNCCIHNKNGHL